MSLGFGFALPAYPLRGGGGNNPFNQDGPTLDLSFTGNAGNLSGADTYTLDTNFITPQYQVAAQYAVWVAGSGLTQRNFADIVTFSRGTAATQFDSTGTLIYAPMNAIRNNTMQGAVAGTPGTLPTNWTIGGVTTGLTISVVGTGTESGITYIDIRFNGTAGAALNPNILFDTSTGIAAASGQTWAWSSYVSLVGGSLTNVTSIIAVQSMFSSTPTLLGTLSGSPFVPTGAALNTQRQTFVGTLNQATTAFVRPQLQFSVANGAAIDITLRIGMPQLELGSTATAVNATSGTAYYGPRFDYNPSTLAAQGLLIEEQRTNSIRNNTMQGAVAGTPGTSPTNWVITSSSGLSTSIVGTGTQNGINYIDVRVFGTTTAASSFNGIYAEGNNAVAASNGQTWTYSSWVSIVGGSTANLTALYINHRYNDGSGTLLTSQVTSLLGATSSLTRYISTFTAANASTAFVSAPIAFQFSSVGVAIDITLRIGLPQLELGAFATSVIPTTTTALTRSADVASVNTLSPWFNSASGTLYAESLRTTVAAASTFPSYAEFDNGTTNRYGVYSSQSASTNEYRLFVQDAGVSQADIGGAASRVAAGTVVKQAAAFAANDFALSVNGSSVFTDTAGTLPSSVNRMSIGSSYIAANFANAWIRRITYYPRRLANADLQTITI